MIQTMAPVCSTHGQGHGFHSGSTGDFNIDDANLYKGNNWDQSVATGIVLPLDSYKAIKNYILLTCEKENTCVQAKQLIQSIDVNINSIKR